MLQIPIRHLLLQLAGMGVVAMPAAAQITINLASPVTDFFNGVTFVGEEGVTPPVPAVFTIDTDGSGNVDGAGTFVTSNSMAVSDNWTITGSAIEASDQLFTLSMRSPTDPVNQRSTTGVGVNGGNPGRIDRIEEFIDFTVDLTGVPPTKQFQLVEIGYDNTNSIREFDPDLVVTDFDGVTTTYEDIRDGGIVTSPIAVDAGDVVLSGGRVGTFRFSQSQEGEFPGEFVGYSLASISFDFVTVPVPDSDFDNDLDVDVSDLLVWQRGFPGTYDAADLADWQMNFGFGGAGLAAISPVPEPSAAVLVYAVSVLAVVVRRRQPM